MSPEFFTTLGGMLHLNIFLLMRTMAADQTVHCGVSLVTNGGMLIKTDDDNTCCVFFQCTFPSKVGHFEVVVDRSGQSRWQADEPAVECLWSCLQKAKAARSVRDMRRKMLIAAQNRADNVNETFQVGDCAWLTVPNEVVNSIASQLQKARERLSAVEAKMLVRIVDILKLPQDAQLGSAQLPSLQFVVCTEDGVVGSTFPIDALQRCYPPPESSIYRVVHLDMASVNRRQKGMRLTRAYKRFVTLHCHRQTFAQLLDQAQGEAASTSTSSSTTATITTTSVSTLRVANTLVDLSAPSASSSGGDGDLPQVSTSAPVLDIALREEPVAASPTAEAVAAVVEPPQTPSHVLMDLTDDMSTSSQRVTYPCAHCGVTLPWDDYVYCFYRPCQVPFHKPGSGCSRADRVVVVDTVLYYCRQACASLDRSGRGRAVSISSTQSVTTAATATTAVTTAAAEAPTQPLGTAPGPQSQPTVTTPAAAAQRTARLTVCNSCLQPMQWTKGAGCDHCKAYHHKVARGAVGCTRAGWSKGGSVNVLGVIQCVPCRYSSDSDWRRFVAGRGGPELAAG